MKSRTVTALIFAVLAAPVTVLAQEEPGLEHLVVEMATTPAQHQAVAHHYAAKAEEARQEMRRHQRMAQAYTASRTSNPQQMRNHCERLAEKYEEIAAEYDELAKLHEEEVARGQ
jgi:hypothetical protein